MIIGFLGKGGSGKTSLATLYTKYLLEKDKNNFVLAIDNDHNMDFKYNLGIEDEMNYMGSALSEIFEQISITNTKEVANFKDEEYFFSLNPMDQITEKYSVSVKHNLRLMVAGPHNNDVLYGAACSHILTTPFKVYLPLLKIKENEFVVVDEKAGVDGVGTGVTSGFNLAVVCAEATTHGIKAAKQIISLLNFYKTPYFVIINKLKNENEKDKFLNEFDTQEKDYLLFEEDIFELKLNDKIKSVFDNVYKYLRNIEDDRKQRTKERIEKQKEYLKNKNN